MPAVNRQITVLLFAALLASMIVLNLCTPLIADDYTYIIRDYTGESVRTLGGILRLQYYHLNGRILLHTLAVWGLWLPRGVFALVNGLVYCGLLWLMLCHAGICFRPCLALLTMIGCWFFLPAYSETVLWTTGSCNYLWGTVLIFLFILPYSRVLQNRGVRRNRQQRGLLRRRGMAVLWAAMGILAGACNENTSGAAILFGSLTLALVWLRGRSARGRDFLGAAAEAPAADGAETKSSLPPAWMFTGLMGAAAGFCLMIFAPSNAVRLENSPPVSLYHRLTLVSSALMRLYTVPAWIYVVLLTLTLIFGKKPLWQASLPPVIFALCGLASGLVMTLSAQIPDRAFFGGSVFLMTAVLLQTRVLMTLLPDKGLRPPILLPVVCLAALCFAFSIIRCAYQLRELKHVTDERDAEIRMQIAAGERDLLVYKIRTGIRRSGVSTLGDFSEDSGYWVNQAASLYYQVDTIRIETVRQVP